MQIRKYMNPNDSQEPGSIMDGADRAIWFMVALLPNNDG